MIILRNTHLYGRNKDVYICINTRMHVTIHGDAFNFCKWAPRSPREMSFHSVWSSIVVLFHLIDKIELT